MCQGAYPDVRLTSLAEQWHQRRLRMLWFGKVGGAHDIVTAAKRSHSDWRPHWDAGNFWNTDAAYHQTDGPDPRRSLGMHYHCS